MRHGCEKQHSCKLRGVLVTLAVVRIPSILFAAVRMMNSPPWLPWREYLVLALGDPNSSLSVTLSLATSAPTTFSGTDVEIWRSDARKSTNSDNRNLGNSSTHKGGGEKRCIVVAVNDGDDGSAGGCQPLPLQVSRLDDQFVFRLSLRDAECDE